jgi:hypothetical protein
MSEGGVCHQAAIVQLIVRTLNGKTPNVGAAIRVEGGVRAKA